MRPAERQHDPHNWHGSTCLRRRSTAGPLRDETPRVDRGDPSLPALESGTLRIVRPPLALLVIVGTLASVCLSNTAAAQPAARPSARPAARVAQDTITMTEESGMSAAMDGGSSAGGCGCNNVQRPPWHGSVHGQPCGAGCGPACGTGCGGVVFQAKPCHQLHLRQYARANCMTLPPCFPRLHTWCAEGYMPTPPSPHLPRCHQCGAVVDGGF